MATVSRQSAFWAVVALGLNTFVQPGGKGLGFPAEYSRALRLSPIVCIVDTLGVLFSMAFFCYKTRSFKDGFTLAARRRLLTEDDPAEPMLERTWWFRFSVFAFGALPQAVKVLAMGGIPLTKVWGMAYLVSFLVLEGLDLLQAQQDRDDHTIETDVAVLNKGMRYFVGLAVFIQGQCFAAEFFLMPSRSDIKCGLEPGHYLPLSELESAKYGDVPAIAAIIEICTVLMIFAPFVLFRATYLLLEWILRPLFGDHVEVIQICLFPVGAAAYLVGLGILFDRLKSLCPYRRLLCSMEGLALFTTSYFFVFTWYQAALRVRWSRELLGLKRREGFLPLLFAAWNITGIVCYYLFIYNPSNTYKPPWTESLG